ncbi:MAG: DNA repair protein RadA [Alphaproteobacteria bacterium]|nr:DNA repair protein RadA [Alphaproteobacteria bacterium]
MGRGVPSYVCQQCGAAAAKWTGRCEACGAWNSLVEEAAAEAPPLGKGVSRGTRGKAIELVGLKGETDAPPRIRTGVEEFDRVCGGGLVPGSALLVGGDPGIGKSTILLQICASVAASGAQALYISGEEGIEQLRLRASRLGLAEAPVQLAAASALKDILPTLERATAGSAPSIVVIDSIQTMWLDALDSAPGTVAQVRASAQELVAFAKRRNVAVLLVGHVTKDGQIAGPRVVEHMVDAVLYFEGDRSHHFRILRGVKNRFGPTDEIGVFEMTGAGLKEVANPSALFLGDRSGRAAGVSVFAGIEGTRPVLVELQALVAPTSFGTPRRAVVGWDSGRLAMILAVLDTHCGLSLTGHDVYLNVAGGLRIGEPAADAAAAAALVSSLYGLALPADAVVFGEISLSGLIRPVAQTEARLGEARKLGFRQAWLASSGEAGQASSPPRVKSVGALSMRSLGHVSELVDLVREESAPIDAVRGEPAARSLA